MIVPLHVHSDNSNLDAISMHVEIAKRCEDIGAPACALTDHGVVTGHLDFVKEMNKVGVKPILGIEAYHGVKAKSELKGKERDQSHLILLAKNLNGLQNLWSMVTEAAQPQYHKWVPRVTTEMLYKYREDIIATSACALGRVAKGLLNDDLSPLNEYLDIFGDNFYLELGTYDHTKVFRDFDTEEGFEHTQQTINELKLQAARERGIPLSVGDDAHYARPDQYELYDAYLASKMAKKGDTIYQDKSERSLWHSNCLYIKDASDVRERLSYLPEGAVDEAIGNTLLIGEQVEPGLPEVKRHLPIFVPSDCPWLDKNEDRTSEKLFIDLVESGIHRRYPAAGPDVWERAVGEMEIFLESGLHHYFLLAWDVCEFCDRNGILRGPGRGSSAGCIVAYALGITDVDPLHYGLIFERFWNPGRAKGFPDIDSDFAREHRGTVIDYLAQRWGKNRVRPIGNTGRMKPLAAIDRFWRACDIAFEDKDELKKIVDQTPDLDIHGPDVIAWSRKGDPDFVLTGKERKIYVEDHVGDQIAKWINGPDEHPRPKAERDKRAKYVWLLEHLVNRIEGYGIHASGVLISDEDLPALMPSDIRGEEKKIAVTSFTMDEVDELMFIKFDVLGLKTLDTLYDWILQVREKGVDLEWSGLDLLEYPEQMWELLHRGFTAGIFQVEGGFARQLCMEFRPASVEDLAIIVALNRPGPIRSKAPERFIARRNGSEYIEYDHPILEPILRDTYGLFIYQEQVIAYFNRLGYDLSESDAVRKILGKKKPEDLDALRDGTEQWDFSASTEKIIIYPRDAEGNPSGAPVEITNKGYYLMCELSGVDRDAAEIIWKNIEGFASYSFNKSHAIAYAVIGFRCLLAKFYAPAQFYRACINTVENQKKAKLVPTYVTEALRIGSFLDIDEIRVFPPDIRTSKPQVEVIDGDIYLGLSNVKGVASGGELICSLRDEGVDLSTPEGLADELQRRADELSKERLRYKKAGILWDGPDKSPKQILQSNKIKALYDAGAWDGLGEREVALQVKQKFEKELLGCIITDNSHEVLAKHEDLFVDCDTYQAVLNSHYDGDKLHFTVPGVITNIKPVLSKAARKPMGIITIEYQGEEIEFATSPQTWKSSRFLWKERQVGLFTLARTERGITFDHGRKLT